MSFAPKLLTVAINFVVDVLYALVDPRLRVAGDA